MNKKVLLSLVVLASGSYASIIAQSFSNMVSDGNVSGQVRMFYIDRQFQGTQGIRTHRNSTAIGGDLKYETAKYNNFKIAAAFYTTNAIHVLDKDTLGPSLLGTGYENYSILGEAYVNYDFASFGSKSEAKLGYQRYDTPMMGSDDCRMVPNTFEAYKYVNHDIKNTILQIAHINAIAYGTYANLFINDGVVSTTSGYASLPYRTGKYYNLGKLTTGKSTVGVTNLQAEYKNKNFFATLSNDYAWDLYNTLYIESGVNWNCLLNINVHPFIKAQFIKQNSVGSKYMQYSSMAGDGEIDSLYGAAKVGAKYEGFTLSYAYSQTSKNKVSDSDYKHAITSQFGGMPAYTVSMVSRHQFLAGTQAQKYAANYSFKKIGVNLSVLGYFASYDVDKNSGFGIVRTATEAGFDVKYYPKDIKGLQLRARGNFPRKFAETSTGDKGWNEYRVIVNYIF